MDNARIARLFDQVADLLEIQRAQPFRVRAYRTVARIVHDLDEPVAAILIDPARKLTDIGGIGQDLATKLATAAETGSFPLLDELREEVPAGVLALLRIPSLGPKKAAVLFHELGVTGLDDLRRACTEQRVRRIKGFGEKTEARFLAGIDLAAEATARIRWDAADAIVGPLVDWMRAGRLHIDRMEVAGSYRRGCETVGDLDLLVSSDDKDAVADRFVVLPGVADVLVRGETKTSVRLEDGCQVDLRVVPDASFGAALQYFTGSKDHNVRLRGMAKARKLKISEWGVFRVGSDGSQQRIAGRTEEEVYAALDLPCFPPELREARREFEWAAADQMPQLIEAHQIVGDLHVHTSATDGRASLEEMVEAAMASGLKYIAITDHSQRVHMAQGLTASRLRAQWRAIDGLRRDLGEFHLLKGIECDILEKGGMDLPDDVLAEADWVVASIHYGQNQSRSQITERILGAVEHRHVSAIAHPTGRLISRRRPYQVDLDAVLRAACRHRTLMELNANPARLDLDDVACAAARRCGVPVVINTDAHSTDGLAAMRYGVQQARRGGLTRDDVANTRPWLDLKRLIS